MYKTSDDLISDNDIQKQCINVEGRVYIENSKYLQLKPKNTIR